MRRGLRLGGGPQLANHHGESPGEKSAFYDRKRKARRPPPMLLASARWRAGERQRSRQHNCELTW